MQFSWWWILYSLLYGWDYFEEHQETMGPTMRVFIRRACMIIVEIFNHTWSVKGGWDLEEWAWILVFTYQQSYELALWGLRSPCRTVNFSRFLAITLVLCLPIVFSFDCLNLHIILPVNAICHCCRDMDLLFPPSHNSCQDSSSKW